MSTRSGRHAPPAARTAGALALALAVAAAATGADDGLAEWFGFAPLEVVKVGRRAGPLVVADMDGDARLDLVVVNNHASRIEILRQRPDARPDDPVSAPARVNELPGHWRFERRLVPVTDRVTAVVAHDLDADGRLDLVYAGASGEVGMLRQRPDGRFDLEQRHRVRNLAAGRDGLAVADITGDAAPELLLLADGAIEVRDLRGTALGPPRRLAAAAAMVAFMVEDFSGDGLADVAAVVPDDAAPVRLWLATIEDGVRTLGAQVRFELPPLVECDALRLPGTPAARLVTIERMSRRVVVHAVTREPMATTGDRDAAMEVHGFPDGGRRDRVHVVVDVDGDGRLDLVANDANGNALLVHRQRPDGSFGPPESSPTLTGLTALSAGNVDDDPGAELFVLSDKEEVVGRCDADGGTLPFPRPLSLAATGTPVAMSLVRLEDAMHVAVIVRDGRDHRLSLLDLAGGSREIDLGKLSRSPESIVAVDVDRDGRRDLLLFTRDKPMMMVHAGPEGFRLLESRDMGQYGLVQAARAENVTVFDVDGDGLEELLIGDENFVRAVRYEPVPEPGTSPGWQVVAQVNARESSARLAALTTVDGRLVAADAANERLVVMDRGPGGRWREAESLQTRGIEARSLHGGRFGGVPGVLVVAEDAFAVVRFAGERITLDEEAAWRSDDEQRVPHEVASGDVNGDGFADLVVLDAGEQMCDILTFSRSARMLHAMGFKVFESMLFTGGDGRQFQPGQAIVADVTGDGRADLVMLAHDRILVHPQEEW